MEHKAITEVVFLVVFFSFFCVALCAAALYHTFISIVAQNNIFHFAFCIEHIVRMAAAALASPHSVPTSDSSVSGSLIV